VNDVVRHARTTQHAAGSVVHEANALLTTVGFVLNGRLKAVRVDIRGVESLFRMIDRGEQYGMMVGAIAEPVPIRVIALEPTTVLNLDYEEAMELTLRHPDLRRLWLKTYARLLKRHFLGTTDRRAPMMVALFHDSYGMNQRSALGKHRVAWHGRHRHVCRRPIPICRTIGFRARGPL